MNVLQYLDLYYEESNALKEWDNRQDMLVRFQHDDEDGQVYLEFLQVTKGTWGKPESYKQVAIESCPRSALRVQFRNGKHTGGYDKAVSECWNPKAGVETVELRYECRFMSSTDKVGEWPNVQYVEESIIHTQLTSSIRMLKGDKLHHNYKPALIACNGAANGAWNKLAFYKDGRQCIPPEKKFPSKLRVSSNQIQLKLKNGRPMRMNIDELLTKVYSRVPKTRWDHLFYIYNGLKYNKAYQESWKWDDKLIPEELFEYIEYPLDDADMFTVMMAC